MVLAFFFLLVYRQNKCLVVLNALSVLFLYMYIFCYYFLSAHFVVAVGANERVACKSAKKKKRAKENGKKIVYTS